MDKILQIITIMQSAKNKNNFKSYTLNIVYDSICQVLQICHKLDNKLYSCFREGIIQELKHFNNNQNLTEKELVINSVKKLKECI